MPSDSLTPLLCGACGGPARVNVAGLHLAVTFPCGWCGKVTMVRCRANVPYSLPDAKPNDALSAGLVRWRRDPVADAREDCNTARYIALSRKRGNSA